jgi:hypothetical protein
LDVSLPGICIKDLVNARCLNGHLAFKGGQSAVRDDYIRIGGADLKVDSMTRFSGKRLLDGKSQ